MKTSAQIFAELGNPWDHDARRNPKPTGIIVREIRRPDGVVELEHEFENEGFDPDGEPTRARARVQVPSPQGQRSERPRLWVEMRNHNAPKYRAPEYRRVIREHEVNGRHPDARDVILTPELLALRKRQQAQVKARMTKAANRIKREREEVWNILLSL
jgi:hypothetical protein